MKLTHLPFGLGSLASVAMLTAADYSVVDIGEGTATAINNHGTVVGHLPPNVLWADAFIYDANGTRYTKPKAWLLGEESAVPWEPGVTFAYGLIDLEWHGINDAGRLVGSAVLSNKWSPVPPFHDLSRYPIAWDGVGDATALDLSGQGAANVNASGIVVGSGIGSFRLDGTNITNLGLAGLNSANDINNQGVIAGSSRAKAALWSNGVVTVLEVFDPKNFRLSARANAINLVGQVAGTIQDCNPFSSSCFSQGFIWSNGTIVGLSSPGGTKLDALDINDSGLVAGSFEVSGGGLHAFVYRDGQLTDLNSLIPNSGWVLTEARAINNSGQIVGSGQYNGAVHAFLLNPVRPDDPVQPSIVAQPQGGNYALGTTLTLTVSASGTAPLNYQWRRDDVELEGETNPILTRTNVNARDGGSYRVVVRNVAGEALSNPAVVAVLDPVVSVAKYAGLTITGEVGSRYRVEVSDQVDGPDWVTLAQSFLTLTNSTQYWFDLQSATNRSPRYYRVVRDPP